MSDPEHIFVYGTLRSESDHPMARRLSSQARLVGKGSVPGRLYDCGWYPAAMFDANEKRSIMGEVFSLKPGGKLLAELDAYEAGDPNYVRVPMEVTLTDGRTLTAWAYGCLLYTSDAADDLTRLYLGGRRIIKKNKKN